MEAQEHEKLVKALRCCAGAHTKPTKCPDYDDSWCGGNCLDNHLIAAADAIEALLKKEALLKENIKGLIEDRPELVEADGHWEWRKPNGEVLMPKQGKWIYEDLDNFRKYMEETEDEVHSGI